MMGPFETTFVLAGRTVPLTVRRMTAREWAIFSVRFARLYTVTPIVRQPHEVGLSDAQIALLESHGQPLTPEQALVLRAYGLTDEQVRAMRLQDGTPEEVEARYRKQEAENIANLAFAEEWITRDVLALDGLDGAAVWERFATQGSVWSSLLFAMHQLHALGTDERKNSNSPSDSSPSSGGSGETSTRNGERPDDRATAAVH